MFSVSVDQIFLICSSVQWNAPGKSTMTFYESSAKQFGKKFESYRQFRMLLSSINIEEELSQVSAAAVNFSFPSFPFRPSIFRLHATDGSFRLRVTFVSKVAVCLS